MKHVELQEFFVEGADQKSSHVLLHITEPSTPQEHLKGYFFAIVEINGGSIRHIEQIQQVIDDIESAYYEGAEAVAMPFETALECINRRSDQILQNKEVEISALVGVLIGYKLSFAYRGEIATMLSYKKNGVYTSIDITSEKNTEAEQQQIFPNLMQGTINPGDYLYIGSPNIKQFISKDRIEKLLFSRTLKQSTDHIEKVLADVNSEFSFGGIFFHTLQKNKQAIIQQEHQKKSGSTASLDKFISAKQSTEDTLSPPLFKEMIKKIKNLKQSKSIPIEKKKHGGIETNYRSRIDIEQHPHQGFSNTLLIVVGRSLVSTSMFLWKFLKHSFIFALKFIISLFILISNKNNSRRDILHQWKRQMEVHKDRLGSLTIVSKLLLILIIIAFVLFMISISTVKIKNYYATKNETYTQLLDAISQKKDEAEARMIYNDDQNALMLLQEAKDLLSTMQQDSKERKATYESLLADINTQLFALQKIQRIEAELVVDLSEQNITPTSISLIQHTLLVFNEQDKNVTTINTIDKTISQKQNGAVEGLIKATTPKEQDEIVLLSNQNKIAQFNNNSQTLVASDIAYPNDTVQIIDASIYNTRLYTLDKKNNAIYKHNKTQTGFDRGTSWLQDTADFINATAITIDGKLYVLQNDGTVQVFEKGIQYDFELQKVDPRIMQATQIWTYADIDELYIFEPSQKRIIVYNKQGTLIKQLQSETWKNPTSMVIDNNIVYILDGSKIYKSLLK